jgi:hypothetical protein
LREAWTIASRTGGIAPIVTPDGIPVGMMTGNSLFNLIDQMAGPHPKKINTTINDVLDLPVSKLPIPRSRNSTKPPVSVTF